MRFFILRESDAALARRAAAGRARRRAGRSRSLLAGCGSLPTNVGKTDTAALRAQSPTARWSRSLEVSSPSPELIRRPPAAARRLFARHPDPARAARDDLARRPVLRVPERPHRAPAAAQRARCEPARRARPPSGRRPLHVASDPLLLGLACLPERRGAALQPVLLQPRRPAGQVHGVDLRLRPAQPPHAQQALHRRRRDGSGGRTQYRRRILRARCRGTSSTWMRSWSAPSSPAREYLRPLLEQRGVYPIAQSSPRPHRRASCRRDFDRLVDEGDQLLAASMPPTDILGYGPAHRRSRRRPARSGMGHGDAPSPIRPTSSSR